MPLLSEREFAVILRSLPNEGSALLITGYRDGNTSGQNESVTKAVRNALSKNGFLYHKILRDYAEPDGRAVHEECTMAYAAHEDEDKLLALGIKLGKACKIGSILFVHGLNNVVLHSISDVRTYDDEGHSMETVPGGVTKELGEFRPELVAWYFTQIRCQRHGSVPGADSASSLPPASSRADADPQNPGIVVDPRLYRPEDVTPMERLARGWRRF